MLGQSTITLNLGTVADPQEITLFRVNNDGYSTEYRLKGTDRDHVLFIRHTKEKAKVRGLQVERHNVLYRQEIYPTEFAPQGEIIEAYTVLRVSPQQPLTASEPMLNAISALISEEAAGIIGWQG